MHLKKKERGKTKQCRFRRHCSSSFFPWTRNRGREVFVLFRLFLPLSPSPRALLKLKPDATDREAVPCKRPAHWTSHPVPWQEGAATSHPMQMMGRGRVVPAPPAPINTVRVQKKGEGGQKKRKKERMAANRERNRKREKPTERERNNRNRETKKPGISTRKPRETVGEKEEKG